VIPGLLGEQQSRTANSGSNKNLSKSAAAARGSNDETKIELILRRHPHEINVDSLRKEYIRTTNEMTVHTLKRYLSQKLCYTPHEHFQVREIIMLDILFFSTFSP